MEKAQHMSCQSTSGLSKAKTTLIIATTKIVFKSGNANAIFVV